MTREVGPAGTAGPTIAWVRSQASQARLGAQSGAVVTLPIG